MSTYTLCGGAVPRSIIDEAGGLRLAAAATGLPCGAIPLGMLRGEVGPGIRYESTDQTRARLARIRERLAAHGIQIPPGRLTRFEVLAEGFASKQLTPRAATRELNELLEGNRDFAEFATIVEQLLPPEPPADPVLLQKLRSVLGGAPLPGEDTNSLARDTQFELYMAARLAAGGLAPQFREPDCTVTAAGVTLGIASKRAKSEKHVERLVRDGARQLRLAGLVGVVALSFDRLFAPNDERVFGEDAEGLGVALAQLVQSTVRPHFAALARRVAGSRVLAVVASLVVVSALPRKNHIGRMSGIFVKGFEPLDRPQYDALVALHEAVKIPPPQ